VPRVSSASCRFLAASSVVATLVLIAATGCPAAQAAGSPGLVAPPAEPLSNYEVATGHTLTRDCGYTAPVRNPYRGAPGGAIRDLWLFCDTINYDSAGNIDEAVLGTDTAAEAPLVPGEVPQDLSEVPTPPSAPAFPDQNGPAPFLPVPPGLKLPGSTGACVGPNPSGNGVYGAQSPGIYPASWISGVTPEPPGVGDNPADVLITFENYCVDAETGNINTLFTDEGLGMVSYDPLTNTLSRPVTLFTSADGQNLQLVQQLGSPVFFGGYLYLFTSDCTSPYLGVCLSGNVYLARAPVAGHSWQDPDSYQYWTGSGWSSDLSDAGNVIPGATPFGISAGNYWSTGHGLVLVAESDVAGGFQVWTAQSPTGPWTLLQTGRAPGTCTGEFGCYALIGHPELSTKSHLLISYYDPTGLGHLHLAAFPWAPATGSARREPRVPAPQIPPGGSGIGSWPPGIVVRPATSGQSTTSGQTGRAPGPS
jgi:hypothetical protein